MHLYCYYHLYIPSSSCCFFSLLLFSCTSSPRCLVLLESSYTVSTYPYCINLIINIIYYTKTTADVRVLKQHMLLTPWEKHSLIASYIFHLYWYLSGLKAPLLVYSSHHITKFAYKARKIHRYVQNVDSLRSKCLLNTQHGLS